MKKLCVCGVMLLITLASSLVYAGTVRMIGTVSGIKMLGNSVEVTLKDRKSDTPVTLQVTNRMEIEKYKDRKIKVGDELRVIYDSDTKVMSRAQKTAGC